MPCNLQSRCRFFPNSSLLDFDRSSPPPLVDLALPHPMAPRFVLLERRVKFFVGGSTGGASNSKAAVQSIKPDPDVVEPSRLTMGQQLRKASEAALQSMKPDPDFVEPPKVSRLTMTMVQQMRGKPPGDGFISSTDKSLAVLFAGPYRPDCCDPSSGCYLVYDASTNSHSAVPQIPPSPYFSSLGCATAILSRGEGKYVLAEIGTGSDDVGVLYLWQPTSLNQPQGQWERKSVCLPPQVFDPDFCVDLAFSFAGSSVCWVDLLQGVLVCDLLKATEEAEPEITFIPLPQGYSIDVDMKPRPRPELFRTMSCVNGAIKFVALVGYYENNYASDNIVLRSWTLSPDLKEWKLACKPLTVHNLWASMSFCSKFLPKIPPVFPILSCDEEDVVYLSLKEIECKNVYDICDQIESVRVVTRAHHVLRVDVVQNKVLDCTKITQGTLITSHWPTMLATDFTSYLHA